MAVYSHIRRGHTRCQWLSFVVVAARVGLLVLTVAAPGVSVLGPEPPSPRRRPDTTAPCLIQGCGRSEERYTGQAVCCGNHGAGAGCCTYATVTVYWCKDAQGRRCYGCGSIADIGGPCANSSEPRPFTVCNTDPCDPRRGQCTETP